MSEEAKRILEGEGERSAERPAEEPGSPVEFKLPPEIKKLPDTVEKLASDFKSFKDSISKTVESLKPEPTEPCPGCGTPIPKSKAEEVKKRLEEKAPVKEVVREVPKVETRTEIKEVRKPIEPDEWMGLIKEAFPERPSEDAIKALERFTKKAGEKGWVKI